MRCADLQALRAFPQDLLPDNLMVNTCVWCSEELSCENPAAAFTVFVLDNMSSQDYSSHVLPFCQAVFQQICFGCQLGSDWPKFTFTFSSFPCFHFLFLTVQALNLKLVGRLDPDGNQTMEKLEKVREWHAADYIHGFYRWRWRWHDLMPVITWCQQEACSEDCVLGILRK